MGLLDDGASNLFKDTEHGILYREIIKAQAPNKDHEDRIRSLEFRFWGVLGAVASFLAVALKGVIGL